MEMTTTTIRTVIRRLTGPGPHFTQWILLSWSWIFRNNGHEDRYGKDIAQNLKNELWVLVVIIVDEGWEGGGGGGGGLRRGRAGGSKSFRIFRYGCLVFWSLWLSEWRNVSLRLSSGPPGGRPHARLKAGTPREAPTPAPTTKTLVPTTVNRRSTRTEATRRAPTFKIMAKRVGWATQGTPRQHREATSHPRPWQWDSRTAQVRRVHSVKKRKLHRGSYSRLLPRDTNTAERDCHTPVDRVSSRGARCPADLVNMHYCHYLNIAMKTKLPIWEWNFKVFVVVRILW